MRIRCLQHVPFEGPGLVGPWAEARGAELRVTHPYAGEPLPAVEAFDALVLMGGPMGAMDDARHPWLAGERALVSAAIDAGRPVLGICLGAQIIAAALGARVYRHEVREIGWFEVTETPQCGRTPYAGFLGGAMSVLHWHGDTFDLPAGAVHLARSAACEQQAFAWGGRVLGLQFHLEMGREGARALIEHCAGELEAGGPWVQSPRAVVDAAAPFERANEAMRALLERVLPGAAAA